MTTLSIEINAARAYATMEGSAQGDAADLAETKVREYAGHHGTPERETTLRLARDAAEQAALDDESDARRQNEAETHVIC